MSWSIEVSNSKNVFASHVDEVVVGDILEQAIASSSKYPTEHTSVSAKARNRFHLVGGKVTKDWYDYSKFYLLEDSIDYISAIIWLGVGEWPEDWSYDDCEIPEEYVGMSLEEVKAIWVKLMDEYVSLV